MKPRHLILTLLALLTSITASAVTWTDANGTEWYFTTSGSNAVITYRGLNNGHPIPSISGTIPAALTIPATVYIGETPYTVTSIGDDAFHNCSSLTSISIPDGVTSIGGSAFYRCSSLTSINIPEGVTSIGSFAFYGCSSLASITIPNSVTSIQGYDFIGCSSLTSITVENGNTKYDSRNGCNAIIETASNTLIEGCNNTIIPVSVTCIGEYAFDGRSNLTSINIPDGVTSIGRCAFYDCSSLTSINIPDGVTSIGDGAFNGSSSLTSIVLNSSTPPTLGSGALLTNCTIFVPAESLATYRSADVWKNYANIHSIINIDDNFTAPVPCGDGTVALTFKITSLEPLEVEASGCPSGLTGALTIPASVQDDEGLTFAVTGIGVDAFKEQAGLTSITIPDGVTSIGSNAFRDCSSLTSITIPEGVTSIEFDTFQGCSSLTSINIPKGITSIGHGAFYNCSNLTSITLPEGVTFIDHGAFSGCSSLTSINIPDGVTSIERYAFENCI